MKNKKLSYKEALVEIESIANRLEHDEPDVDELSGMITQALALIKICKQKLKSTETDLNAALDELE